MKNSFLKAPLALVALLAMALPMAQAQVMTKTEQAQAKTRVDNNFKADKKACDAMAGNAKDVCIETAKGTERVAYAQVEYQYTGKASDQNKVLVAQAESTYAVAKEKCDDKAGNVKDVCVQEAKAAETKALAEAKLSEKVSDASKTATQTSVDADYKVAIEKCDSMAGDSKSACVSAARAKYGKS